MHRKVSGSNFPNTNATAMVPLNQSSDAIDPIHFKKEFVLSQNIHLANSLKVKQGSLQLVDTDGIIMKKFLLTGRSSILRLRMQCLDPLLIAG